MKKSEFNALYQKILDRNHDELSEKIAAIKHPTNENELGSYIGEIIQISNNTNAQILFDTITNLGIIEND